MSQKNTIKGAAFQMDYAADHIMQKYLSEGYDAQKLSFSEGDNSGCIVQVRNVSKGVGSVLKTVVGLQTCGTLKMLSQPNGDLLIEVMGGKWLDKAAVIAVSWFVLWPLLITGGIGTWKQNKLLNKMYEDTLCFFAGSSQN